MHAELPSEARAQRVRERLNELFAALFTSAPSSLQSSSKSSAAVTHGASRHQESQEQQRTDAEQDAEDTMEGVDGEETLDKNPYRQRLRDIYRERDAVTSQARELMRQLDTSKVRAQGTKRRHRRREGDDE